MYLFLIALNVFYSQDDSWQKYLNKKFEFEVSFPDGFEAKETPHIFYAKKGAIENITSAGGAFNLEIMVCATKYRKGALGKDGAKEIADLIIERDSAKIRVSNRKKVTRDGVVGEEFRLGKDKPLFYVRVVESNKRVFILWHATDLSKLSGKKVQPRIEKFFDSFRPSLKKAKANSLNK